MSELLSEQRGGVRWLTLNRPERLNAFTPALHEQLRAALDDIAADPETRAVVLTGAGRGFCAGQDLGNRDPRTASEPPDLGHTLDTQFNPLVRAIRALPLPVICAVNGVAAGAGANVALACDLVIAARSARFIQSFAKIGLVPDSGGTWTLTRLLGEARAKALMLTGDPIDAAQAAEWGLIARVVDDEQLSEEAQALAERLAAGPSGGLARTKAAIHAAGDQDFDAQLDLERDLQRVCGRSSDYAEGVLSFLEKRAPSFGPREVGGDG